MRFAKIKIGKDDDVELTRLDEHEHSTDTIATGGVNPLPSFKDALQAFLPFFLNVVPSLDAERENLRVSSVSLSSKDGKRTIQVSASLAIPACNDAVISLTTPRISEAPEHPDDEALYLEPAALKLIAHLESEATRYANGETAQGEMFVSSENAKAADQRMADAEVSSTRKPRGKRGTVAGAIGAPAPAVH